MYEPTAFLTIAIIIVTGVMTFQGFKNQSLFLRFMFDNQAIARNKQYDRLLSSGLLHADWMHFGFNMFSLYSFGRYMELVYSPYVLLFIYISSILGGNLLSLGIYRHTPYRAIGASGGVCGVIYASIFLLPGGGIYIFPLPVAMPSWLYAILFLVISAYGMRSAKSNIGHVAHLGGALVGLAVTFLMYPQKVTAQPALLGLVILISAGIFVAEYLRKGKA